MSTYKIKYEEKTYKTVYYKDLEVIIKKYLGIENKYYSLVRINDWTNEMCVHFPINNTASDYDIKDVAKAKAESKENPEEAEPNVIAWVIMSVMCHEGLIEKGDYLIDVWW